MLTITEQRLEPEPEVQKAIHDSIYPPGSEEKPQLPEKKLTTQEQERLSEEASKTNVLRSIMVSLKSIASDVRAILIAMVSLCWAIVGLTFAVSFFIFLLMAVLATLSSRFTYLFFSSDKGGPGTRIGIVEQLKDAAKNTILGRGIRR